MRSPAAARLAIVSLFALAASFELKRLSVRTRRSFLVNSALALTVEQLSEVAHADDAVRLESYSPDRMTLFDTRSGVFLPPTPERYIATALQNSAGGAGAAPRVIFAGETHTHPLHHYMQLELIKALQGIDDAPLAIGLEMFHRQHQRALDAFVFGDGSFAALKKRTQWDVSWGYDMALYAKILSFARRNQIRLVGLNVPYDLIKIVATYGLAGTPDELRALMPEIDLHQKGHFERFVSAMKAAGHVPSGPESAVAMMRSYEAMTLWDEYMAESIAGYMQNPRSGRMVVLAGSSHVAGRVGVPDRYTRRSSEPTFSVVPCSVPWTRNGLPSISEPLGPSEGEWILYTQEQIETPADRGASLASAGSRVEEPRISSQALGIGTSAAPVFEL